MADIPLYQELIDFWKAKPKDKQIYKKIIDIMHSLCGTTLMAACESFFEFQFSESEIINCNAESFK